MTVRTPVPRPSERPSRPVRFPCAYRAKFNSCVSATTFALSFYEKMKKDRDEKIHCRHWWGPRNAVTKDVHIHTLRFVERRISNAIKTCKSFSSLFLISQRKRLTLKLSNTKEFHTRHTKGHFTTILISSYSFTYSEDMGWDRISFNNVVLFVCEKIL